MITIEKMVYNPFQENTYLLFDETKECVIVDPGCLESYEEEQLAKFISDNDLKPVMVLNTHLHLDHVFGCRYVCEAYNVPFLAHKEDEFFIGITTSYSTQFGISLKENPPELDKYVSDGDIIKFGNSEIKIIHIPGHSPGGVILYCQEQEFIIAGDALFEGSVGRTDLTMGNHELLISSIKSKLLVLGDNVLVFPGHGSSTSIGAERKSNPYLV